jgi:uracil-DNA glycosylase
MYSYEDVIKRVHPSWLPFFEQNKEELEGILDKVNKIGGIIYPREKDLFRALYYHDANDIKLVILAQDPYINEEMQLPQAMGLCLSVPKKHKKIPPSLQNIFKEIQNCYPDYNIPKHGLLKRWARAEKILLLNATLTVTAGKSNSHSDLWLGFTDKLIKWFQQNNNGCIFLLMGAFAQKKAEFIDCKKHKIFKTVHPSPLSAHNGFFGCKVFSKINNYLLEEGKEIINW